MGLVALVAAEPQLTASGLGVEYLSKPDECERLAKNGDMLEMHYTGTLEDGKKFDSSRDRSAAFKFQIGVGLVFKGWEEGVLGMCVGEKRKLIVPPALGYGDQGAGDIIAGGEQGEEARKMMEDQDKLVEEIFAHEDKDKDGLISHDEFSGPKHDEL